MNKYGNLLWVCMKKLSRALKGQVNVGVIITILIGAIALTILLPLVQVSTVSGAIDRLEGSGYVVLSSAEYDLIAKEATAYAAVQNANAAVVAAELAIDTAEIAAANAAEAVIAAQAAAAKVELFNCAEVFLFPSVTDVTITLTAGATNVWSAWVEVVDSTAVTLSSKFATKAGYINDIYIYDHSAVDKLYCIELAYGASKTTLGRIMWHTSFKDAVQIKSRRVPVGETVYYRMMCSGANSATAKVGFRYFFE